MLLDVLTGIEELQVAVAYEWRGKRVDALPSSLIDFSECRPIYESLPGWTEDVCGVRNWSDLPANARGYVEFLSRQVGVPVSIVSVGPDRRQTIPVT
jgi:adenylosuccinate synthase